MKSFKIKRRKSGSEVEMFKSVDLITIYLGNRKIGRMLLSQQQLALFEYDPAFLVEGYSISPFYLPLKAGVFTARRDPFDGLFGVFNDSLPDGWGMLLLDRYMKSKGLKLEHLTVLDRLSLIGASGLGALRYEPEFKPKKRVPDQDILFYATEVQKILSEAVYHDSIEDLFEKGGSSGGARPKVFIKWKNEDWIVKFPASTESIHSGQLEYTYAQIAQKCGIEMPETHLFEGKYFGVRRFDRVAGQRIHMHSASGLLYASHRYPSLDYMDLIKSTWALTKSQDEVNKIFRQMVFNVLTGNKDDHAKNFSFLYKQGEWMLSPAYDLTLNSGFKNQHSTTIAGQGNPKKKDVFEVAIQTGIPPKHAQVIWDEVYENAQEIRLKNY